MIQKCSWLSVFLNKIKFKQKIYILKRHATVTLTSTGNSFKEIPVGTSSLLRFGCPFLISFDRYFFMSMMFSLLNKKKVGVCSMEELELLILEAFSRILILLI
jgi:hypothetical protein